VGLGWTLTTRSSPPPVFLNPCGVSAGTVTMFPGADDDLLVAGGEPRRPRLDDEDLRVRVQVEVGPLTLVRVLGDEDRDRDLVAALEERGGRAATEILDRGDGGHRRSLCVSDTGFRSRAGWNSSCPAKLAAMVALRTPRGRLIVKVASQNSPWPLATLTARRSSVRPPAVIFTATRPLHAPGHAPYWPLRMSETKTFTRPPASERARASSSVGSRTSPFGGNAIGAAGGAGTERSVIHEPGVSALANAPPPGCCM
jgi:hypothetical protein